MARGFGSGVGVGVTDVVDTNYTGSSTLRSWFIRAYRISDGSGHVFGAMIDKRTDNGAGREFNLGNRGDFGTYHTIIGWSSASATWEFARPLTDVWHSVLITYDGGSTANDPVAYVDGASTTVTEIGAPSGSLLSNASEYMLGNRLDGIRCWDGYLSEFAIWDRILNHHEAWALGKGFSPLWFKRSLVLYVPMLRDSVNMYGAAPTITGTAVQPHPRNIYPKPGRAINFAAAPSATANLLQGKFSGLLRGKLG